MEGNQAISGITKTKFNKIASKPLPTSAQSIVHEELAARGIRQHEGIEIGKPHGSIDMIDSYSEGGHDMDQAHGIRFRIGVPPGFGSSGEDRPAATKLSVISVRCGRCAAVPAPSSCGSAEVVGNGYAVGSGEVIEPQRTRTDRMRKKCLRKKFLMNDRSSGQIFIQV